MAGTPQDQKIFPRNQTARSDVIVRGNPVTTRPDDAVENTFPGLEFDHRNLEKQFFPGLVFELHHPASAWLRSFNAAAGFPITEADRAAGLTLWHVIGNFPQVGGSGTVVRSRFATFGTPGTQVWQILRELEEGDVAIALGPVRDQTGTSPVDIDEQVDRAFAAGVNTVIPFGASKIIILFGRRAAYLVEGVINTDLFEPGDLTRSLCAPWQYDFTDCGCWYWASNKPDMVSVKEAGPQIYNFQRDRSGIVAPEPPTHPPVVSWPDWRTGKIVDTANNPLPPTERVPRELNHAELITAWESLPVVVNDVENTRYVPRPSVALPEDQLFPDLKTIVSRLSYLASIEHALMIEYLYAHYSINAARTRPEVADVVNYRRYEAANAILSVAIDEMRHFRWVNEILVLLGSPPVVERALKTVDINSDGRFLDHAFSLMPADQERIDWFISIEKPSQSVDPDLQPDTIDGMYTRLLFSIERTTEISQATKNRVLHLVKLIIDEGFDHFHRFTRVKQIVPAAPDISHLRLPANPGPLAAAHPAKEFELRVDRSYEVILNLLLVVFGRGDAEHGDLLEATRIAMVDSMDAETLTLIANGGAPLFSLPRIASARNLGRFMLERQALPTDRLIVMGTPRPAASARIVVEATKPLDELNQIHSASGNEGLREAAARSAVAMQRVRARFSDVIRASGQ